MFYLACHGGLCCGIKHIYHFGTGDTTKKKLPAKLAHSYGAGNKNLYTEEAPTETAARRLKRIVAFKDRKWPYGIIEVVLTDYASYGNSSDSVNQVKYWQPVLEKLGFKLVSKCYNSNSGNNDYVFHRCKDKPKRKKKVAALRTIVGA